MTIEFLCDTCGTRLRVPDGSNGKRTKCPQCETILTIPATGVLPSVPAQPSGVGTGEWSGFESSSAPTGFHETGNPWQAPMDFVDDRFPNPAYSVAGVTGDRLGFTQAFTMTYETLKSNFLPFFVLGLILIGYYAVVYVISLTLKIVSTQEPSVFVVLYGLFNLVNNIVAFFLGVGISYCALELIRTGSTSARTGFSILTQFLSLIVFWIILGLLVRGYLENKTRQTQAFCNLLR